MIRTERAQHNHITQPPAKAPLATPGCPACELMRNEALNATPPLLAAGLVELPIRHPRGAHEE